MAHTPSQLDKENLKYQKWALGLGIILITLKGIAYWITNSNAILTDALEGLVNIFGAGFGLFSVYYATLPRDKNHPYGHGKVEYLSSGFEGTLIIIAGVTMIVKAVYAIFYPEEVDINFLAIGLVTIAGIANWIMGAQMVRRGKEVKSVQLQAGGKHLISDGYSTAGLLIGLGIVWVSGMDVLDNVLAILLGIVISVTGYKIIRKSIAGVMDEADPELIDEVAKILQEKRQPAWVDIHNVRIVQYGAKIHLDAHITLPWYYSLQEAHDEMDKIELVLMDAYNGDLEPNLHSEPCIHNSCGICSLDPCEHRKYPFRNLVEWNVTHIQEDQQHTL